MITNFYSSSASSSGKSVAKTSSICSKTDANKGIAGSNVAIKSKSLKNDKKSSFASSRPTSSCPICNLPLVNDENIINMHIDLCLSKANSPKNASSNGTSKASDAIRITIDQHKEEVTLTNNNISISDKISKDCHSNIDCKNLPGDLNDNQMISSYDAISPAKAVIHETKLFSSSNSNTKNSSAISDNNSIKDFYVIEAIHEVPGLWIIHDFITEEEETQLLQRIDSDTDSPWEHSSFNGHCFSKKYGVRTQFGLPKQDRLVRENDVSKGEYDLPDYLSTYTSRWQEIVRRQKLTDNLYSHVELLKFVPNECNMNSYFKAQKNYLKPHFDDRNLSGPLLINLSLLGRSKMTYLLPPENRSLNKEPIPVFLPRRCLQLVTGPARWNFMHMINANDVLDDRRVSITWRQCGERSKGNLVSASNTGQPASSRLTFKKEV